MSEKVHYEQTISASLSRVWEVVSDFGSLLGWVVGGDEGSISLTGEGVGMLRDIVLPSVGAVQHSLDELDHDKHRLTYTLTKGQPLGMEAYSVTLTLQAAGDQSCQLLWDGVFTPTPGADADAMGEGLRGAYADMSDRLDALLGSG